MEAKGKNQASMAPSREAHAQTDKTLLNQPAQITAQPEAIQMYVTKQMVPPDGTQPDPVPPDTVPEKGNQRARKGPIKVSSNHPKHSTIKN